MTKKDLLMKKQKLVEIDTLEKTYGCRHSNPEICSNNGIEEICAFCSEDKICKRPPKSWKRLFEELKTKEEVAHE